MEAIHELKRPTISVTVYKSHVEIKDRAGCTGWLSPRNISIPIRNISTVDVTPMTETITIHTNDGKALKFRLGGLGGSAKKLRDAIFTAMA